MGLLLTGWLHDAQKRPLPTCDGTMVPACGCHTHRHRHRPRVHSTHCRGHHACEQQRARVRGILSRVVRPVSHDGLRRRANHRTETIFDRTACSSARLPWTRFARRPRRCSAARRTVSRVTNMPLVSTRVALAPRNAEPTRQTRESVVLYAACCALYVTNSSRTPGGGRHAREARRADVEWATVRGERKAPHRSARRPTRLASARGPSAARQRLRRRRRLLLRARRAAWPAAAAAV